MDAKFLYCLLSTLLQPLAVICTREQFYVGA